MEREQHRVNLRQVVPEEEIPALLKNVDIEDIPGSDHPAAPVSAESRVHLPAKEAEHSVLVTQRNLVSTQNPQVHSNSDQNSHVISILPTSPRGLSIDKPKETTIHPQPAQNPPQNDKRFDPFKTWSGRLERQISNLRGRPQEPSADSGNSQAGENASVPVDRYFDALEGPELDTLKASEVPVLPEDQKWPFLLRFPISSYGICLGLGSQAILWKTLATSPDIGLIHVGLKPNLVLWCTSLALLVTITSIYLLKIVFYFEAVKREYYHPVRVNFFFAPWIACLFLAMGVPPSIAVHLRAPIWYVLMSPILCLELKIYGQWMSGGQRRLSKVANPSNHLSIVGNFVGALLGATMGLKEGPIFFFAVGLAHYIVLFVTLYQRLPTNVTLPKELHPVFFLFVAAPSVACVAWARIRGDFDYGSRIAYFIALFLYVSLAVRINFFRGFRFSLAWWAYTFPMTGASVATIRYSIEKRNMFTQTLALALIGIATLMVTALFVSTIFHAFVLRDLFPNDVSIAISEKRLRPKKKHGYRWSSSSDSSSKKQGSSGSEADSVRSQLSV